MKFAFEVNDKVIFAEEKAAYKVQACDDRFVICTRPHYRKKTVWYSIIDWERGVRGTENLIFCMGFESRKLCNEALKRLQSEESEVTYRNYIDVRIISVKRNGEEVWPEAVVSEWKEQAIAHLAEISEIKPIA